MMMKAKPVRTSSKLSELPTPHPHPLKKKKYLVESVKRTQREGSATFPSTFTDRRRRR